MSVALKERVVSRRVQLMATCLCDAFFGDVAKATYQLLERFGCEIEFPEGQTCCGQPAFNGGDWKSSRQVVRHTLDVFAGDKPVIVPSGSCAAMLFHGAPLEFEGEADERDVGQLASRSWELCDFLVNGLGVDKIGGRYEGKLAVHNSCHTRGTGTGAAMRQLLDSVEGLEVVPFGESDQCCGFGGTFSVSFPHVSTAMGCLKLDFLREARVDTLISGDMSCLMHLRGLSEKEGQPIEVKHVAQVLRDALQEVGEL